MNALPDISDDEFVPFLHSLGVETFKKSFEWMLNDPASAGVLRWLYDNLDQNNALTDREEYRYNELQKSGTLLSADDLETSLALIQQDHPGICLPGDQEALEDVKIDINMCKEKLRLLGKQETVVKELIMQNELAKEELTLGLTRLNSAYHQCTVDETETAETCTALAQELETITDDAIDVIAENMKLYTSCKADKETAMRFLAFNPLESYRQSQTLFRSHFDLYVSKNLPTRKNEIADEDLRAVLIEAKNLGERLSEAAFAYIETKAELSGEQAKLSLVSNYHNVHPSQITACVMEAQSALDLLEQEENIMSQQAQHAVERFVKAKVDFAVDTAASAAFNVRQKILTSLNHLVDIWHQAYALDRLLYYSLRHELRTLEEFLLFASDLKQYSVSEANAVASRIESMNEICIEQESCSLKLETTNPLTQTLCTIFGEQPSNEASVVNLYNNLTECLKELKDCVNDGFRKKENAVVEFKSSTNHLREYVWSGCTKQANCWDQTVASLSHSLKEQMESVDRRVVEASSMFTSVKGGDKQNLRKLWQWFLTDPSRLQAAMKSCRSF